MSQTQIVALGMLGLSGYAVYNRSQKVQNSSFNIPLAPAQELSSRAYIVKISGEAPAIKAIGDNLNTALIAMNWALMPDTPSGDPSGKSVQFANTNVEDILWTELFKLNGLEMMRLCNAVRLDITDSALVFDLNRRTLITPIDVTLLDAVKAHFEPA